VEARFSAPVQTGPGDHLASCTVGNGSFPGVKSGRGVTLTPHPLLVPRSRKSRAIPLLPLWAVRTVQSLSACTTVRFYLLKLRCTIVIVELSDLYPSPNILRVIKSRRMRLAGNVARMGEERGVCRVLVGKPEGKRPLGRPRR